MSGDRELFDVGLQPERTALAWRRTALSVALGSLVAFRLLPELLGNPSWSVTSFVGVLCAALIWAVSEWRYRAFYHHHVSRPHTPFGAWPLLLLAAGTFLLGLGATVLALALVLP